jgi:hypothetical protein
MHTNMRETELKEEEESFNNMRRLSKSRRKN